MGFRVEEHSDTEIIKGLFVEYSHIKGAESCFVSFDKELNDLEGYYSGGAILIGYEEDKPVACVAVKKINDETCEGKRLFNHFIVLEKFFDCWCDMTLMGFNSPSEFLASIFSIEHEKNKVMVDSINIFEDCVHNYADQNGRNRQFPLGRVILLYALCIYLQHRESVDNGQLLRRIRIVNNLIKNSNDEISDRSDRNRMQALLQATEDIIISGTFKDETDNNFNVHQIAEEKEKISFVDSNPDMVETLYSLEDHDLLRGQISIIGLDHLDLSNRFVSLFACDQDRIDCALMAIGDISQQERRTNWRYQFASYGIKDAWLNLFHKSGNSLGFEKTHEVLVKLLSQSESFDDDVLRGVADDYIAECENNHIFPWRYYYIKYSEFRPGRYGKAFFDDKENKPYEDFILNLVAICLSNFSSCQVFMIIQDKLPSGALATTGTHRFSRIMDNRVI
ncbi:MAG: hypothetical protein LKF32_04185 [Mageeibacillus sp.]|jgi:hypothetical protein|nr:hypothetical protein [Mageeibacillus sp.]MCI1263712.1 hypothetical protein [Saccharofermentans sp.]